MRLNGKQITLIVTLAVLLIAVISCAFIFRVNSIEVNFLVSSTRYSDEESVNKIVKDCQIKKGNSVFLLNKQKVSDELEVDYPYLDIINIEVIFPNIVRIHCVERIECYAIKLTNNNYAICDKDLKVLRFSNSTEDMVVIKDGFNSAEIGAHITYENSCYYSKLIEEFEKFNQTSTSIKFILQDIELNKVNGANGDEFNLNISTDSGINIEIQNITTAFSNKVYKAYILYSQKINENFSNGIITVGNYSDERVFVTYSD